jgi:hypothetical protein
MTRPLSPRSLVAEVLEGGARPELEGFREHSGGSGRITFRAQPSPLLEAALEAAGVQPSVAIPLFKRRSRVAQGAVKGLL